MKHVIQFSTVHKQSTNSNIINGVRLVTQKALHGLSAQRQVSLQEAVHLVDNQDLVICSEYFERVSITQAAILRGKRDKKARDIVSVYRNRPKKYHGMSMDEFYYKVFRSNKTDKPHVLLPNGHHCKPVYPVTYGYARSVIIQHMPWSEANPPTELLKDQNKTIQKFKSMIDKRELPSSIYNQYICAIKYSNQKRLELIAKEGLETSYDLENMTEEERDRCIAHQHASNFSTDKYLNNEINGSIVDIGEDFDWSTCHYKEKRKLRHRGDEWVNIAVKKNEEAIVDQANAVYKSDIIIPKQKDNTPYSVTGAPEQERIVNRVVDTIIKFLSNDPSYKPMRATIMGSGGTGKSHIINTIIGRVRAMTSSNNTVQVSAPSGAAAYNVQGTTLHRLLSIGVKRPDKDLSGANKERLMKQLERLLVLIIDERSMISSTVLAAAERNTRQCVFNGQNSMETWGGLPVVLLFGDDYQLMPVKKDGAIHGYAKRNSGMFQIEHASNQSKNANLLRYCGDLLFAETMTQEVYCLTKNYRVKDKKFKAILRRLRIGKPTNKDAKWIMNLHTTFHKHNEEFKNNVENNNKTMWLFTNNKDVDKKNDEQLVLTSSKNKTPVALINCWFDTVKTQSGSKDKIPYRSHFDIDQYVKDTKLCVGAKVALRQWNIMPSAGLYNGSIGKVIEIVYTNPVGPNDKEHNHLPDYVVVDFPHLNLPPHIEPWDRNHPTVSILYALSR